uniref:Uncharacterized protein n=1 Tax=viral metagenome TaxID=1070528 RepID=A0A6H1ZDH3_9ZZZZ
MNVFVKLVWFFAGRPKKHFMVRIWQNERKIWDTEFRQFNLRQIKEGIRREYDRLNEHLLRLKAQDESDDKAADTKDQIQGCEADVEKMKKQLDALENELVGEHQDSIRNQLAALNEVQAMLKSYIKKL